MSEIAREMSYGQRAVGLTFNPSGDDRVHAIKAQFAAIIDVLDDLRQQSGDHEVKRMCSVAITESQSAQMWAVKAITYRP